MMGCKRGDIYMARLSADEDGGSLQEGMRPILIISNDKANEYKGGMKYPNRTIKNVYH